MQNILIITVIFIIAFFLYNRIRQGSANVIPGITKLDPQQYQQQFKQAKQVHILLDVRTPEEFVAEHLAGAVNIPVQNLSQRLQDVPTDRPVVLMCRSGNRTKMAAQILAQAGYTNVYDLGGLMQWKATGLSVR
ncbi:MAG: rhodanese-like domain-containing protein [Chloroflexi bacterium]|nr:rhodanese-like domain-containing protein [Chloroflexota bacterium]